MATSFSWSQRKTSTLQLYGCFLKWWYPQNTPKWSFLVGKPIVVGYHHFRNPPIYSKPKKTHPEAPWRYRFFVPLFMGHVVHVFIRRESELRELRSVRSAYVRFPQRISKFPKKTSLPANVGKAPPHLPPSKKKQQMQTKHEVSTTVFDINVSSLWILCDLCALLSSAVSWNCQSTFWCFHLVSVDLFLDGSPMVSVSSSWCDLNWKKQFWIGELFMSTLSLFVKTLLKWDDLILQKLWCSCFSETSLFCRGKDF